MEAAWEEQVPWPLREDVPKEPSAAEEAEAVLDEKIEEEEPLGTLSSIVRRIQQQTIPLREGTPDLTHYDAVPVLPREPYFGLYFNIMPYTESYMAEDEEEHLIEAKNDKPHVTEGQIRRSSWIAKGWKYYGFMDYMDPDTYDICGIAVKLRGSSVSYTMNTVASIPSFGEQFAERRQFEALHHKNT